MAGAAVTREYAASTHHRGLHGVTDLRLDGKVYAVMGLPDAQVRLNPVPLKRLETGEVVPDEVWHRRGGLVGHSACGLPIGDGKDHVTRMYTLDDQLCAECWSHHELALGMANATSRRMRAINGHNPTPFDGMPPIKREPKKP